MFYHQQNHSIYNQSGTPLRISMTDYQPARGNGIENSID